MELLCKAPAPVIE